MRCDYRTNRRVGKTRRVLGCRVGGVFATHQLDNGGLRRLHPPYMTNTHVFTILSCSPCRKFWYLTSTTPRANASALTSSASMSRGAGFWLPVLRPSTVKVAPWQGQRKISPV